MAKIKLKKGQFVEVDEEDVERVSKFPWRFIGGKHRKGNGYAITTIDGKTVYMHRFLLENVTPIKETIDHVNSNGLDNRKENLRIATVSQQRANSKLNGRSSTGFKGVIKARKGAYRVAICHKHIGTFKDKIEAAKAYNEAALQHFGQFARINEI